MIFPIPKINFGFFKSPMTLLLILLNVSLYVFFADRSGQFRTDFNKIVEDKYFHETQAQVYKQFVFKNEAYYSYFRKQLVLNSSGKIISNHMISNMSLSDSFFVENALTFEFSGDQVALADWRTNFNKLSNLRGVDPGSVLGVSQGSSAVSYVTYQFMHAGFAHLFLNMFFLFILGGLFENRFGSLFLLIVYLGTGVIAAQSYLALTENNLAPLVGASGSISGIMAAYCVMAFKKSLRFFYMLFIPDLRYVGYVYLPTWVVFFFWLVSDLSGYLSQIQLQMSIAYVAHLGGQVSGFTIGICFLLLRYYLKSNQSFVDKNPPVGTKEPFLDLMPQRKSPFLKNF